MTRKKKNKKKWFQHLKPISISYILAHLFDIVSTIFALKAGAVETNFIAVNFGWGASLIIKFLLVVSIVWIFERLEDFWLFWIFPIIAWAVVIWNMTIFVIILVD